MSAGGAVAREPSRVTPPTAECPPDDKTDKQNVICRESGGRSRDCTAAVVAVIADGVCAWRQVCATSPSAVCKAFGARAAAAVAVAVASAADSPAEYDFQPARRKAREFDRTVYGGVCVAVG